MNTRICTIIFSVIKLLRRSPVCSIAELCLTSNVKGQTVPSYDKHHFLYWYNLGHPCVICVSSALSVNTLTV